MVEKRLPVSKHIAVDIETYKVLSSLGGFHESFNDIINRLIVESRQGKEGKSAVGAGIQSTPTASRADTDTTPNASLEGRVPQEDLVSV